ncbi:MAG: hypothetical protein H7249_16430, partial [Chitinophagaceae bacterium]|nr:hypothetical protein [Oligoflexus sp.]
MGKFPFSLLLATMALSSCGVREKRLTQSEMAAQKASASGSGDVMVENNPSSAPVATPYSGHGASSTAGSSGTQGGATGSGTSQGGSQSGAQSGVNQNGDSVGQNENSEGTAYVHIEVPCGCSSAADVCSILDWYDITILDKTTKQVIWGPESHKVVMHNDCAFTKVLGKTIKIPDEILARATGTMLFHLKNDSEDQIVPFYPPFGATGGGGTVGPAGPAGPAGANGATGPAGPTG